jgi:hypothetical protein
MSVEEEQLLSTLKYDAIVLFPKTFAAASNVLTEHSGIDLRVLRLFGSASAIFSPLFCSPLSPNPRHRSAICKKQVQHARGFVIIRLNLTI